MAEVEQYTSGEERGRLLFQMTCSTIPRPSAELYYPTMLDGKLPDSNYSGRAPTLFPPVSLMQIACGNRRPVPLSLAPDTELEPPVQRRFLQLRETTTSKLRPSRYGQQHGRSTDDKGNAPLRDTAGKWRPISMNLMLYKYSPEMFS